MSESNTVPSLFDNLDLVVDERSDYRELALEAFKGKHWAKGIVMAEKTDMEDHEIQFFMGLCLETGNGTRKDYAKAFDWYSKAAGQGNAKAMRNLGKMYADGVWTDPNRELAVKWYVDAIASGDTTAKNLLADLCDDMDDILIRSAKEAFDKDEFERGVSLALNTDMSNSTLQMWVGYCYDEGKGVKEDGAKAFEWYEKAAENGNVWSMNRLGELYIRRLDIEYSLQFVYTPGSGELLSEAFRWYKAAAEKGNKVAQYNLGGMYEHGKGTEKNLEEAVRWYKKSVEQGYDKAQKALERVDTGLATAAATDPMKMLNEMIGLQSVKDQVKVLADSVKVQRMREAMGMPVVRMSYHCIFTGNPGTGKTTVARIYAKILHKLGIIKTDKLVEADRSELVGCHIGETEAKVSAIVNDAMNGVLFVDEAYALYRGDTVDFGQEAIDTLLKKMEDNRDSLVVIFAGYESKMARLFEMNEGMRSRFPHTIKFSDYTADELVEIFKYFAAKNNYVPDEKALSAVREESEFELAKRMEGFGNARYIRTLFEQAIRRQSGRIVALGRNPSAEELQRITVDDIPAESGRNGLDETLDDILEEMDGLVGLESVKGEIRRLALFVQNQERRKEAGLPIDTDSSYHCVFAGNPGTGKTTVARYMARVFRVLGITKTDRLEETDRSRMVARYIGQTAPKTDKVIDAALNGVLFIDEAYSLVSKYDNDFGHEAIATLLKRMEDDRDRLVVIVAGYTKEMKDFIDANPGLKSRFTRYIEFPDYSADELVEVFSRLAKKNGYRLSEAAMVAVGAYVKNLIAHRDSHFGNAREMRNFFKTVVERQSARLASIDKPAKEQLMSILPEDISDNTVQTRTSMSTAVSDGGITVCIDYMQYLNLAFAQNSYPLVSSLRLLNGTGRELRKCICRVSSPDGYFAEYRHEIACISAGGELNMGPIHVHFNVSALQNVESVKATCLCVEVLSEEGVLFHHEYTVDAVAPSHAYDIANNPEMLVSYVLPHCNEIRRLQSETAKQLARSTGCAALCSYAEGRKGVIHICNAAFEAIKGLSINYTMSPAKFGLSGQKIRLPSEIIEHSLATCMDSTLLFAALMEACRINSVIVLVKGHAFLGVFLEDRELSQVVVNKPGEIKKYCEDGVVMMIETTSVCFSTATFDDAVKLGMKRLYELDDGAFQWAIDVRLARESGIRQLTLDAPLSTPALQGSNHPPVSTGSNTGLTEAHLATIKSPSALIIDGVKVASVRRWEDVFLKLYERLNEMYAAKFNGLVDDAQFGRYFMCLMPGQKTPRDHFRVKLGTESNVRAKKLANKMYLWRSDYYFRRLLDNLGLDAARIDIA